MCEFCENLTYEPVLYQKGTSGEIYLVRYGYKTLLLVEEHKCPIHARCSAKYDIIRSEYEINYCPNCGEKLDEGEQNDGKRYL